MQVRPSTSIPRPISHPFLQRRIRQVYARSSRALYVCHLVKLQIVPQFLYSWEWVTSLSFDWQFLSGKKKFRWPMVKNSLLLAQVAL